MHIRIKSNFKTSFPQNGEKLHKDYSYFNIKESVPAIIHLNLHK